MKESLLEMQQNMEKFEISIDDIEELEEMITPGSGTGCNCNSAT